MKKIILILLAVIITSVVKATIVNICGTDTIILQVSNYVNGTIEWQQSVDAQNWAIIAEETGITYKFFPTQTMYYRAVVKTTDCCPLYSDTSFVELPPIANAGSDRTIGTSSMTLLANTITGAIGQWTILKGTGGTLDDSTKPNAVLTGQNNETYELKWTLTNACGQSNDTVNITFDQLTTKTNFIVVDKTDSIYSDSIQLSKGIYRIKFSDTSIAPCDSVVLIGMREDISFLRKTISFDLRDSVYTFYTEQGTLSDLFKSGVLNIGDAVNQALVTQSTSASKIRSISGINNFPTRETLKAYTNSKDMQVLFVSGKGNIQKVKSSTNSADASDCFTLSIDDQTLFTSDDSICTFTLSNAYIKLYPKFVCDYKYSFPTTLSNIRIGVDNAQFEYNLNTTLQASKGVNWSGSKKLLEFNKLITLVIYGVPVVVNAKFVVKASGNFSIEGAIKLDQSKNYKLNLTALIKGDDAKNLQFYMPTPTTTSINTDKFSVQSSLNSELKIGPEVSFLLYGIVGPYLNLPVKLNVAASTDLFLNWNAEASVGFEGYLGASADVVIPKTFLTPEVNVNLFHFEHTLFDNAFTKTITLPYKLEPLSGNFQTGSTGSLLSKPIGIKVVSDLGFGVPFVPVRFSTGTGNGTLDKYTLYTDFKGEVYPNWTLGNNLQNKLTARVLDSNGDNIENSPLIIYATTEKTNDCANSSLYISMKSGSGSMTPVVSGGVKPYTYSTNGTDFSSTVPAFSLSVARKDTVFVKDGNGCIRSRAFSINPLDACSNSNLSLDVLTQPNIIILTGKNGVSPYQYAVDNGSFSNITTYYKLSAGTHTTYVKDAKNCTASKIISVTGTDTVPSITASYPTDGGSFIPASSVTFKWSTANYSASQTYDLYLKTTGGTYTQLITELASNSYTYSTALANSTAYSWKVAVKVNGSVVDSREFSFTTSSGLPTTPSVPTLLTPGNGSINNVPYVTLSWQTQNGDFVYDIFLDTKDASTILATNVNTNSIMFGQPSNNKLYYWKVKIKNRVTGEYRISAVQSFTLNSTAQYGTVTDIDGNIYRTITIGTQTWMAENLKTTKYRNGESITNVTTDNSVWKDLSTGAWSYYSNNETSNGTKYGKLYNWYAVADSRNIAPVGWHVPTDAEWTTLENYLIANGYNYDGTTSNNKIAKALAATTYWATSTSEGTIGNNLAFNNSSGFSALPGGCRSIDFYNGGFGNINSSCHLWSATEYNSNSAYGRGLGYSNSNFLRPYKTKSDGRSVRCVRDILPTLTTSNLSNITSISTVSGGLINENGGSTITASGVCWNTTGNPTIANGKTADGTATGSFTSIITGLSPNTTYYVRAYATNNVGTAYGNEVSFTTLSLNNTVTDIDGNVYHTVTIGTQTWMTENLKTTKFRNGDLIKTTEETFYPNDLTSTYQWQYNFFNYGCYYTWYAIADNRGIAPVGWHIPSYEEWETMLNYLKNNGYNYDSTIGDNKIAKSLAATTNWLTSSAQGAIGNDLSKNNLTSFTALPSGYHSYAGVFYSVGENTIWWSSSELSSEYAKTWLLQYNTEKLYTNYYLKNFGFPVRCIKD